MRKTIKTAFKNAPHWILAIGILTVGLLEKSERSEIKSMHIKIAAIEKDVSHIQINLGNHIGDTNKKIEQLSNRFDNLSGRFDRLYEILLQGKGKK